LADDASQESYSAFKNMKKFVMKDVKDKEGK
jgi:hypothetical protein